MTQGKTIAIIIPVFNEDETIPLFYDALCEELRRVDSCRFKIIFTNNRSTDHSLDIIRGLMAKDSRVGVLTLSRNFGYQASVLAGITTVDADAYVIIDVDGEDPPELIPVFLTWWEKGFDVVYGIRRGRHEFFLVTFMRKLFYRLMRSIGDSEIILDMAEFSLFSRRIRDIIIHNKSTYPFIRTEIGYAGFDRKGIAYHRKKRLAGKSHYDLLAMIRFAVAGILSSSTFLLRLSFYLFPLLLLVNFAMLISDLAGVSKMTTPLLVINLTYIAFFLASCAIYISRIYHDQVGRPVFIIDEKLSSLPGGERTDSTGNPLKEG